MAIKNIYSGAPEKWHRQPFEHSPLFKGLEENTMPFFGEAAI